MGDVQPQPLPLTQEAQYYDRQLRVSNWGPQGQKKLGNSSVLVVGAGGLGCPALLYLTGAGIGRLGVVDGDVVSISNLPRQTLFTLEHLGENKAIAAKKILEAHNPWIKIVAHPCRVSEDNLRKLVESYDLIIDGTDNFLTKYLLHDGCRAGGKPLIMANLSQWDAQIQAFNFHKPGKGCLRCLYPTAPEDGCVGTCADTGVAGALAGTMGSLEALAAVQILLDMEGLKTGETMVFNLRSWQTQKLKWKPDPHCPGCSQDPSWVFLSQEKKEISWGDVNSHEWTVAVDLRETSEYQEGDWELLKNKGLSILKSPLSTWPEQMPPWVEGVGYLFICAGGYRSIRALNMARNLNKPKADEVQESLGQKKFVSLAGGVNFLRDIPQEIS